MRRRLHAAALAVAIAASSSLLAAQEWPRFRGNEAGVAAENWKGDSTFMFLFGEPGVYAKDWTRPARGTEAAWDWRLGDPLTDFAG